MTFCFELAGVILSFIVFVQDYPVLKALWISIFHSIAAFNNSGFDILGGLRNLIPYQSNVLLNLTTCGLIIFGGLGFLVILDILKKRSFRKLTLHSKVVLSTTLALLLGRYAAFKGNRECDMDGCVFSERICTYGRIFYLSHWRVYQCRLIHLDRTDVYWRLAWLYGRWYQDKYIFFVLVQHVRSLFTKRHIGAFRRSIPFEVFSKACTVTLLSMLLVCGGTFLLCVLEPEYSFVQLMFEEVSAFGTVGLSTGITPDLGVASKLVLIFTMFAGRVGAFTLLTLWIDRPLPNIRYTEESITIG